MKIRNGFVSNSSSSSFIINKEDITGKQYFLIREYQKHISEYGIEDDEPAWFLEDRGDYLHGSTSMDNFDMEEYLKVIGVNPKKVKWDTPY